MKCFVCRGQMEDTTTSEFTDFGACIIIVRGIPCHKCTQCGEFAYDLKIGVEIEKFVDALKESLTEEIAVVQYSRDEIKVVQYASRAA